MKNKFSKSWIKSKQPRKQRKYRYNAPLHIKRKFLNVHLSPNLRQKYSKRSMLIKVGDYVKIMRGDYKGNEAKVEKVSVVHQKVYLSGMNYLKKEGSKVSFPFEPSNLMIIKLGESRSKLKEGKNGTEKTS